jgi:hypothetical protein
VKQVDCVWLIIQGEKVLRSTNVVYKSGNHAIKLQSGDAGVIGAPPVGIKLAKAASTLFGPLCV